MTYMDTAAVLHTRDPFDGLHPNAGGYRKIAALCERQLVHLPQFVKAAQLVV